MTCLLGLWYVNESWKNVQMETEIMNLLSVFSLWFPVLIFWLKLAVCDRRVSLRDVTSYC